ncbi:MAG: DUF2279 domain-containing protein [Cyclobacteriaceae bacterium]|nr:DUF2279 domain-containing protein [Cyclobacteriaceae bacterium]
MDKTGHFYSAFQFSSISSRTLRWSGVEKRKSDRLGTLTSFAIMSSIEVLDGFSAGKDQTPWAMDFLNKLLKIITAKTIGCLLIWINFYPSESG